MWAKAVESHADQQEYAPLITQRETTRLALRALSPNRNVY